jgi:2,3-dihydroxy-p-cumate/2,3-dihydroxybenzoate 3,4-dioxygenase
MIDLHDIRYLRIATPNLEQAVEFATRIVGLELVAREGKAAYFRSDRVEMRGDTRDHTLVYYEGDPSQHAVGFDLKRAEDFDTIAAALEAAGAPAREGSAAEAESRRVKRVLFTRDPSGNSLEIVARPYHSGQRGVLSRDAGVQEFSHIGLKSANPQRDEAFWTRVLNARVSEWVGELPFFRINTVHHSVVLFPSPQTGVQHINHQVEDHDDVMRSYYFLKQQGVKIIWGPGRHPVSTAMMLYFEGPDGMVYEYSVGVKHITPGMESTYRPRQFPFEPFSLCMWGSRPVMADFDASAKTVPAHTPAKQ